MAYCRWNSDDFQCDVYVYKDVHGGYTTHVAGNRVAFREPLPDPIDFRVNPTGHVQRMIRVVELVRRADRVPINGPHDGESFNDPTPGECADRLEALRAAGYRVPQDAIDALREEEANATDES